MRTLNLIFLVGTAGSGKSLLTSVFSNWLKLKNQDVISVNLDPGVLKLPYTPDVDVREYVSLSALMERHTLGPNGALILASDLIASKITSIRTEVEEYNSDYVLVDTPGQMELFAFRQSGLYIADELSSDPKIIIYLFDATFSSNPLNYVSNMFLATAVQHRFFFPQLCILSKADLLSHDINPLRLCSHYSYYVESGRDGETACRSAEHQGADNRIWTGARGGGGMPCQ